MACHRLLCFRWCVAEPCYQYQWVVRDGDVFCQRSDGLRVDSKTALYFSLINKIMFSISQHDFIVAKRIEEGNIKDMSKGIGSVFYNIIILS